MLRDAFTAHWAADGHALPGDLAGRDRARTPGFFGWELSPPPESAWALARLVAAPQ